MGQPILPKGGYLRSHLKPEEASGGTETSKYPEEKKSTEIPLVVASERGEAQTAAMSSPQALSLRGCRAGARSAVAGRQSYKSFL